MVSSAVTATPSRANNKRTPISVSNSAVSADLYFHSEGCRHDSRYERVVSTSARGCVSENCKVHYFDEVQLGGVAVVIRELVGSETASETPA